VIAFCTAETNFVLHSKQNKNKDRRKSSLLIIRKKHIQTLYSIISFEVEKNQLNAIARVKISKASNKGDKKGDK
jgi:hypothetical protein